MSENCEKKRIAFENARAEIVNWIASPNYTREKCKSLQNLAEEKKTAYIYCLYYAGIRPIPILLVPGCPYKEGPAEYLGPEAAAELREELDIPEPTVPEPAVEPPPPYRGTHARMFPFPVVVAELATFRDIFQNRHAWFKRLHDILHPLI